MLINRVSKDRVIHNVDCTGCGLCAKNCPSKCISMEEGKLGHLYPIVNNDQCINCNLCVIKCPSNNEILLQNPLTAYAAWAKDKNDYQSSTSGGAASILSRKIITDGGVVYGCAMLSDCNVQHIRIDNCEQLYQLKGSKYVQSTILNILPSIKEDVRIGAPVLFIGTPCQTAAVKSLFMEQPSNLYLIDIICHGVPSLSILKKYLINKFGKTSFDKISFRKGSQLLLEIFDSGKKVYDAPHNKDLYYTLFMQGYTYRDSCHQCKYAQPKRVSDITIGDFWGLGKMGDCDIPDHKDGISVILPITEKGEDLIKSVSPELNIYCRPLEEAIKGNSQLQSPSLASKRIRLFQVLYPLFGLEKSYKFAYIDNYIKKYLK